MPQKFKGIKPTIVVIGGGAAGIAAALELADRGYFVELFEKNILGSGASGSNPGRMGHGFHYTDIETAKAYLRASVAVQRKYPGYLIGQDEQFDSPLRHGRYFITKNSDQPKETILATYKAIKKEYKRLIELEPENEVFGPAHNFYRILDPSEYEDNVNMNRVDVGIETNEHLFNWPVFLADIKQKIINHPNIRLHEHTEVTHIHRNKIYNTRFTIEANKTADGVAIKLDTNFIVNSTWQDIKRINDTIGLRMVPGERTNRLKTLIILKLPKSLKDTHSMFFCMGKHCMVSNLGNRQAMATFASITNLETSSGLTLSKKATRFLSGGATTEEKTTMGREMIDGIAKYIPKMAHAKFVDLKFGVIQTKGDLALSDLEDPNHPFHKRDDHCVKTEQIGLISNPCMKLFYFVDNATLVADLIDEHQMATEVIHVSFMLIEKLAQKYKLKFDKIIQRAVLENLERYESSKLTHENIAQIVKTVFTTIYDKVILQASTYSFFAPTKNCTTQDEQDPSDDFTP